MLQVDFFQTQKTGEDRASSGKSSEEEISTMQVPRGEKRARGV